MSTVQAIDLRAVKSVLRREPALGSTPNRLTCAISDMPCQYNLSSMRKYSTVHWRHAQYIHRPPKLNQGA